jgi:peptidoglycan/LPS O-acetylase OafA/YrhL
LRQNTFESQQATGSPIDTFSPTAPAEKEHLGVLDFLRGFAALSVVLYHFTFGQHTQGKLDGGGVLTKFFWPPLKPLFAWGHLGVEVFFVISGFVIPYSLWNVRYQVRGFFTYMLKRIVRICPPAYMAIILTIGVWLIIDQTKHI